MTQPGKRFECPHCGGPVEAAYEDLDVASSVVACPACGQGVYFIMGKLANFQPGNQAQGYAADYDDGS